jgi:ABC-type polysaccharide/polyol phosphate export permease
MSAVADRPKTAPQPEVAPPAHPSTRPVRVIEPWKRGIRHRMGDVVRHRRMFGYYGRSFVRRRYRNTWLGWIWLPLRSLIDTVMKAFLFGGLLSVSYGKPSVIVISFATGGWLLFQRTSYWGTRSMRVSRTFIRNAHPPWMPRLVAIIIPAFVDFLFSVVVAVIALFYYWIIRGTLYLVPSKAMLLAFAGYGMLIVMGMSLGFFMSPFTQFSRDVRYTFTYVMMVWYYLSPIVYTRQTIPEQYQSIMKYNPLTAPLELVQKGFLGAPGPEKASVVVSLVFMLFLIWAGLAMVNRFERSAVGRL